jgi:hypothetical protein
VGKIPERIVEIAVFKILEPGFKIDGRRVFLPASLDSGVNGFSIGKVAEPLSAFQRSGFFFLRRRCLGIVFVNKHNALFLIVNEDFLGKNNPAAQHDYEARCQQKKWEFKWIQKSFPSNLGLFRLCRSNPLDSLHLIPGPSPW